MYELINFFSSRRKQPDLVSETLLKCQYRKSPILATLEVPVTIEVLCYPVTRLSVYGLQDTARENRPYFTPYIPHVRLLIWLYENLAQSQKMV